MKINFLGTGTSVGVPFLGCLCPVCLSTDSRNKRLRTSAFIEFDQGQGEILPSGLLIDSSTDLRQQMLCLGMRTLAGVFYTHAHADHVNGIDDLRPFNFNQNSAIPIFSDKRTISEIQTRFPYVFSTFGVAEGGSPPRLEGVEITPGNAFLLNGVSILPISIFHGGRRIIGLRIGNLAYLTDCSGIPDESLELLQGLDVLVLSALRHEAHPNHLTIRQAVATIEGLSPKRSYLTHIAHELEQEETNKLLRQLSTLEITLAHDGLSVEF